MDAMLDSGREHLKRIQSNARQLSNVMPTFTKVGLGLHVFFNLILVMLNGLGPLLNEDLPLLAVWGIFSLVLVYLTAALWWCLRGQRYLAIWQDSLYQHFLSVFRETDLLYIVLEKQFFPDASDPMGANLLKLGRLGKHDQTLNGRIGAFVAHYKEWCSKLSIEAYPKGFIYRLPLVLEWWFPLWLVLIFLESIPLKELLLVVGILLLPLLIIPIASVQVLSRAQMQCALADILLGDVDLVGEEATG